MAHGPGKYDWLCTYVREKSEADAAFVIVVNGNNGSSFSSQILGSANTIIDMAQMLENMAVQLREDAAKMRIGEN